LHEFSHVKWRRKNGGSEGSVLELPPEGLKDPPDLPVQMFIGILKGLSGP